MENGLFATRGAPPRGRGGIPGFGPGFGVDLSLPACASADLCAAVAGVGFGAPGFGAGLVFFSPCAAFAALAGLGAFSPGFGPGFAAEAVLLEEFFGFGAAAVSSATRAGEGCTLAGDGFAPGFGAGFAADGLAVDGFVAVVFFAASAGFVAFVGFFGSSASPCDA